MKGKLKIQPTSLSPKQNPGVAVVLLKTVQSKCIYTALFITKVGRKSKDNIFSRLELFDLFQSFQVEL